MGVVLAALIVSLANLPTGAGRSELCRSFGLARWGAFVLFILAYTAGLNASCQSGSGAALRRTIVFESTRQLDMMRQSLPPSHHRSHVHSGI